MNKKGFTLIEILGVMVLIATLTLLVLPNIINRFSNKKEDISNTNKEIIIGAAKLYVSDNKEELNDYSTYCIDINSLIEKKYLSEKKDAFNNEDYADTHKVKVTIGKPYEYEVVESGQCTNKSIYATGNKIKVNDIEFYIISSHDDYVVALKAEPLTVDEINTYGGVGTENNHVNVYSEISSRGHAGYPLNIYNHNGYGGMAYYTSEECGVNPADGGGFYVSYDKCNLNYDQSDVKYVVDNWYSSKFNNNQLKEVDNYKARIPSQDDLSKFYPNCDANKYFCGPDEKTPEWLRSHVASWLMQSNQNYALQMAHFDGSLSNSINILFNSAVCPIINVYKSAVQQINAG